jgi:dTDP-glucose 4,6-dehydratase
VIEMRMIVTGGAGFIGSNFVLRALAADRSTEITVLDSLTYAADTRNLESVEKERRYRFVKGDIKDPAIAAKLVPECDVIINFAAESHVDYSIANPRLFYETNVLGTLNMLEAARKYDKRFIQISTDEVYGDVKKGESRESDALAPSSPYSSSKASADLLVCSYCRTYGLDAKITRTTNNYGPFQHIEKLIPKFVILGMLNRKFTVYGSGESVREWIHARDNCDAILAVLKKGRKGEVYNIGSGERRSVMDIARLIVSQLGRDPSLIAHVEGRPGEDSRYALDSSKTRALGWKPSVTFEQGIADTIGWYRENRAWWEEKAKTHDLGNRHTKPD